MATGDIARKYLDIIRDLENDDVMADLERLRQFPFKEAEEWYREAIEDYLKAKLEGVW